MKTRFAFKTAYEGLVINGTRSLLTVLGVSIGVMAIILIMAIGRGVEGLILGELDALAANTIVVRPGKAPSGPSDIAGILFSDSLKRRELEALRSRANVPTAEMVTPMVFVPGSVVYGREIHRTTMLGVSAEFMSKTFNIFPQEGLLYGEEAIRQKERVAVIGSQVKEELFGDGPAVGNHVRIQEQRFRVIGVLPPRGQVVFFNMDDVVFIPYSTAQTYITGTDHFNQIMIRAETPELVARTVHDAKATLRELQNITDPSNDYFHVETQQGVVEQVGTIMRALTAFLMSVVAIALLVGGIGVMNIMLVSVTERTKEIGLRKALGATDGDILTQFLLEAVFLTAFGGLIGVLAGAGLGFLASVVAEQVLGLTWPFSFPYEAAVLGVGVACVVGLIFGIYPARKAAQKSPIEALRYE